jgi:hypothetical protein
MKGVESGRITLGSQMNSLFMFVLSMVIAIFCLPWVFGLATWLLFQSPLVLFSIVLVIIGIRNR